MSVGNLQMLQVNQRLVTIQVGCEQFERGAGDVWGGETSVSEADQPLELGPGDLPGPVRGRGRVRTEDGHRRQLSPVSDGLGLEVRVDQRLGVPVMRGHHL